MEVAQCQFLVMLGTSFLLYVQLALHCLSYRNSQAMAECFPLSLLMTAASPVTLNDAVHSVPPSFTNWTYKFFFQGNLSLCAGTQFLLQIKIHGYLLTWVVQGPGYSTQFFLGPLCASCLAATLSICCQRALLTQCACALPDACLCSVWFSMLGFYDLNPCWRIQDLSICGS